MSEAHARRDSLLSVAAMLALVIWAWHRLDFFTLARSVIEPDGSVARMPNALATVDHPFHAARFQIFLDALREGEVPRWVFSHQGGYPSEFYPFGSSVVDLVVWAITLGQMSVPMVHTWAVALVFAAPAFGFWGIARLSGLSAWIAPLALAIHLCMRGWWWSGGSRELVEWGLITNVLAAALVFLALVAIGAALSGRSRHWLLAAAPLLAWAEYTNPRSLVAIAALVLAAVLVCLLDASVRARIGPRDLMPAGIWLGLCAPLLIPLFRYRDSYYFVHYSGYGNLREWIESSIQAVSGPGFALALAGLVIALTADVSVIERLIGWTLVVYGAGTAYLVAVDWPGALTEQLETTRLMPFQRSLMVALAGIAVGRIAAWLLPRWSWAACAGLAGLVPILYVLAPPGFIPESDRGLIRNGTMADPAIAELRSLVRAADSAAPEDTAILILGSTVSWHDQFWAMLWSDRLYFFDDWLWYWQREHAGVYDPETEHAYPEDGSTIDPAYLETHGIGAVIVTGQAQPVAAEAPYLERISGGIHDLYLVRGPTTLATLDGSNIDAQRSSDRITVDGLASGGTVTVRTNWFPRWRASVDGKDVPVIHRADGYIDVTIPAGSVRLELDYRPTALDWLARFVAFVSGLGWVALMVRIRPQVQPSR